LNFVQLKNKVTRYIKKRPFVHTIMTAVHFFTGADMPVYAVNAAFFLEIAAFPLMVLILSAVRYLPMFDPQELGEEMISLFPSVPLISSTVEKIATELENGSNAVVSLASAVMTLFSASSGILSIVKGFERLYNVKEKTMLQKRLIAMLYTLALLILALLSFGTQLIARVVIGLINTQASQTVLQYISDPVLFILKYFQVLTLIVIFLMSLALYCFPIGHDMKLRDQIPGAVITTAGGFLAGKLFAFAISSFWKPSALYGSLTAVILIAYWGYIAMMILFFGAAYNKARIFVKKTERASAGKKKQ